MRRVMNEISLRRNKISSRRVQCCRTPSTACMKARAIFKITSIFKIDRKNVTHMN